MSVATFKAAAAVAVEEALAVAARAAADEYSSRRAVEAATAAARTTIQAAIDEGLAVGVDAWPAVTALRRLAARLLDLSRALAEDLATMTITLTSERGVVDLALSLYGDGLRAVEIVTLNPSVSHPHRMPAGTDLTVYVQ